MGEGVGGCLSAINVSYTRSRCFPNRIIFKPVPRLPLSSRRPSHGKNCSRRLIQATLCEVATAPVEKIKQAMIDKHVALIAQAADQGAQVCCLQEIFYGPYFCAEQETRWYESTESIPDGPTTKLMQHLARQHNLVLVVPMYEEDLTRSLLQHGRGHRRRWPLPWQIPQDAYPPMPARLLGKILFPSRQSGIPGIQYTHRESGCLYLL